MSTLTSDGPGVANARFSAGRSSRGFAHELAVAAERLHHEVVAGLGLEVGDDVVPEQRLHRVLLESPDAVVADDRGDVDAVAHERVEITEREPEGAVAEQQHELAPGRPRDAPSA